MPYNSIHTGEDIDAGISKTQGVASNATANATDAQLRDRGTHTGTQPLSSISDAGSAATASTEDFATAAQGSLADTAQQPPTEGAFVDGDKTKLDNIEASADVTDTANVTSAGALMDSEVTNLAQVKSFDSSDYAPAAHTQAISTVTGLQGALDGKLVSGSNISLLTNDSGFTTNTALSAIATNNAGSSEPNTTFAHMLWFDTNNDLMKMRNEANSAWVIVAKKDGSGWTPYRQGTALGTASVQPDNRYAHRSNNLSDLGSATTARANLGLASANSPEKLRVVEEVNNSMVAQFINSAGSSGDTLGKGYIGFGISNSFEETGCYIGWDQESVSGYQQALTFGTRPDIEEFPTERMRITSGGDVQITKSLSVKGATLDPGGTAPMHACRAWVNFNGTGTVAIRGGGNVSSVTDNGVGDYTVNFTTAMQDANYAMSGSGEDTGGVKDVLIGRTNGGTKTTTACRIKTVNAGANVEDFPSVEVMFFR